MSQELEKKKTRREESSGPAQVPNKKPVAHFAMVASNNMIGVKPGKELPYAFDKGCNHMVGTMTGALPDSTAAPLRHNLIFGRVVYEEFMGYGILPLGSGINVVVSSTLANKDGTPRELPAATDDDAKPNSQIVAVGSIEQALEIATPQEADDPKVGEMCYVLGGGRIFADTLPKASVLRIIHMKREFEGDIFYPKFNRDEWSPIAKLGAQTDTNIDGSEIEFEVIDYVRKAPEPVEDDALVKSLVAANEWGTGTL